MKDLKAPRKPTHYRLKIHLPQKPQKLQYKLKINGKKIAEDQQTLSGEYVIDAHQDCKICPARHNYTSCNYAQDSGRCLLDT